MYKQLKKQIDDRRIIHITRLGIEKRIQHKIDNQLGLHGMSFQEVKVQMGTSLNDRFTKVFADVEDLENQRLELLEEENVINEILEDVNRNISNLNDIEHKVFRAMYLWGKTQQQIADSEGYSLDRIKQISRDINEKLKK